MSTGLNGVYNALFIVTLMFSIVGFAYAFSIGDLLVTSFYNYLNPTMSDATLLNAMNGAYINNRTLLFNVLNHFVFPFLIFMSMASSFVNRNQTPIQYVFSAMAIVLITPLLIYLMTEILTNMVFGVTFIDFDYCLSTYLSNFVLILVLNGLASLASFVFVQKQVTLA